MGTVRRSRMHRESRGKCLVLTERDLAIFRALGQYRYLRSTYLHAFAGGASENRFKERLGDLFHEGFIDRPNEQWEFAGRLNAPVVYQLGRRGREGLRMREEATDDRRVILTRGPQRQFAHALMTCDVVASFELSARASSSVSFVPVSAILKKAPRRSVEDRHPLMLGPVNGNSVIPDALFALRYESGERPSYRFIALEVDRGTMPVTRSHRGQTSVTAKLDAYEKLICAQAHKRELGIPNLLVLLLTTSESRKGRIIMAASSKLRDTRPFLFGQFIGLPPSRGTSSLCRYDRIRNPSIALDRA